MMRRALLALAALPLLGATHGFQTLEVSGSDIALYQRSYHFTAAGGPIPLVSASPENPITAAEWNDGDLVWSVPTINVDRQGFAQVAATATQGVFSWMHETECDDAGICMSVVRATNTSGAPADLEVRYEVTTGIDDYKLRHLEYDPAAFNSDKLETLDMASAFGSESAVFRPSYRVSSATHGFEFVFEGDFDASPADRTGETPIVVTSGGTDSFAYEPMSEPLEIAAGATWEHKFTFSTQPYKAQVYGDFELWSTPVGQVELGWFRDAEESGRVPFHMVTTSASDVDYYYDGYPMPRLTPAYHLFRARFPAAGVKLLLYGAGARSWYLDPVFYDNWPRWRNSASVKLNDAPGVNFTTTGDFWRFQRNEHGEPFWPSFVAPLGSPGAAGSTPNALCTASGVPYATCTGAGTGTTEANRNWYGYVSGCNNDGGAFTSWDYMLTRVMEVLVDPRYAFDGLYFDFGNLSRSCPEDERITHASQQAFLYQDQIRFYRKLWRMVKQARPNAIIVIHTPGTPVVNGAYTDLVAWGESMAPVFGGESAGAGCADGECTTATEYCAPRDTTNSSLGHCKNTLDDDGDGNADLADAGCADANDDTEDAGRTLGGYCPRYRVFSTAYLRASTAPSPGYAMQLIPQLAAGGVAADRVLMRPEFIGATWSRCLSSWNALLGSETPGLNSVRNQWGMLEDFGSLKGSDLRCTPSDLAAASLTVPAGLEVGVFAHPDIAGCSPRSCDAKGVLVAFNRTAATVNGTLAITDQAALGLLEGALPVTQFRSYDPLTQPSTPTRTYDPDWGALGGAGVNEITVSIPAFSYKAFPVRRP